MLEAPPAHQAGHQGCSPQQHRLVGPHRVEGCVDALRRVEAQVVDPGGVDVVLVVARARVALALPVLRIPAGGQTRRVGFLQMYAAARNVGVKQAWGEEGGGGQRSRRCRRLLSLTHSWDTAARRGTSF